MSTFVIILAAMILGASALFKFFKFLVALGFISLLGFIGVVAYFIYLA